MVVLLVGSVPTPAEPAPTSRRADAAPPLIGSDLPRAEVIEGFLKHVAENEAYDAKGRAFVRKSHETGGRENDQDVIQSSLAVLVPRFRQGLEFADKEQPAKAADIYEELSRSDDPYLAVAAAELAASGFVESEQVDRCYAMLQRVAKGHSPITRYTLSPERFEFMLGYCQVHNLDYEAAQATLEDFLTRYPHAPERLRVTAVQIVTELSRRVPGRLGDVHDLMNAARRGLAQGDTGVVVVGRQERAVALLDDLIKEAEEQEKSQDQGGGGGKGKGGNPNSGNQPGGGAAQSVLPGGPQRDAVLGQAKARPGEAWGKMPPREREEILQSIQKQFPSRYRELLEQYYKELAKDQAAP